MSRNFDAALEHLSISNSASSEDSIDYYLGCAEIHHFLNNKVQNQIYADSAKIILEKEIMSGLPNPQNHINLGKIYAYLDRNNEARVQAEKADESVL